MHRPIKYAEKVLTYAARGVWTVFDAANRINQKPSFTPKWSDKPLLKSYQKSKPPLGWPRTTDSLCPRCVPEIRQQIVDGTGRVAAHEIMVGTPAIRNLIRENKVAQMYSMIQTGAQYGMQTLDQTLLELVRRNVISVSEARIYAKTPDNFAG